MRPSPFARKIPRMTWQGRDLVAVTAGAAGVLATVALIHVVLRINNPTIGALVLLLVVLVVATATRLEAAIATSLLAMLAFNYFFLPPLHTFTIADPQNLVALFVFLAVAGIASHLSTAARARTREVDARRQELSRLFDLSRDVLLTTERDGAFAVLARQVARRFQLTSVGICLPSNEGWTVVQGGDLAVHPRSETFDAVFAGAGGALEYDARERAYTGHVRVPSAGGDRTILAPIRLGTRTIGMLATNDALDVGTLDAIAGIVAIAIERLEFLEERRAAELTAQRAELSSALLASLSHDLRTPLTAARVGLANAVDVRLPERERLEQGQLALRELDRLGHLFDEILDMARIDAGALRAEREWTTPSDIVDAALAAVAQPLAGHRVEIHAADDVLVETDPRLTTAALVHILENAARYSPRRSTLRVRAIADDEGLRVSVDDEGPGLDPLEVERLFEPFFRGSGTRTGGTGLGLSITRGLLAAQGGRVWAENLSPRGARFTLEVPARTRAALHEGDLR